MKWKEEDIKFLKENYKTNPSLVEISKQLKRSIRSIQHKGIRLGLFRPRFKKENSDAQPKKVINKRYYENNKKDIYKRKQERIKKNRDELKKLLGGECSICGYKKCFAALDFHHNSGEKEGNLSYIIKDSSKQKSLKEIKKCILLCGNCHRELHSKGSVV